MKQNRPSYLRATSLALLTLSIAAVGCASMEAAEKPKKEESKPKITERTANELAKVKVIAIAVNPPSKWDGVNSSGMVKDVEQTFTEELDAKNWDLVGVGKVKQVVEELRRQNTGDLTDPETVQRAGRQLNATHLLVVDISRLEFQQKTSNTGKVKEVTQGTGIDRWVPNFDSWFPSKDFAVRGKLNVQLISVETAKSLLPMSKEIKVSRDLLVDIFEDVEKAARELAKKFPNSNEIKRSAGDADTGSK